MNSQKTPNLTAAEPHGEWWVVDAQGVPLGRLAAKVAAILRGKHLPTFTPNVDCGDFVIVVNADKVALTGKKLTDKLYYSHSGYPGHLRTENAATLLKRQPTRIIEKAVKGMLPHCSLGRKQALKLKIYAGDAHPHAAQQPKPLTI
jgi:large subunit ribosomal protein L13